MPHATKLFIAAVVPRSLAGFKFTSLPVHAAQTFRERGRMGNTTVWFDYRIPNG